MHDAEMKLAEAANHPPCTWVKVPVPPHSETPNMSIARGARSISSVARCLLILIFDSACAAFLSSPRQHSAARVHTLLHPPPSANRIHAPYFSIIYCLYSLPRAELRLPTLARQPIPKCCTPGLPLPSIHLYISHRPPPTTCPRLLLPPISSRLVRSSPTPDKRAVTTGERAIATLTAQPSCCYL
ncbi:hypothetical protein GMOD_00006879 [Pyrenophora seminiperda CCB06]|uniref:Uncharacterized protein n=1 Tax=Pyrenophora seminiperda CCB06 TaxID=1302712 RepID=A0A3M7MB38_9PLEO|nr:hypothetical protein GMOD_00006879 [Pyrenophora seminiperda CCB06]